MPVFRNCLRIVIESRAQRGIGEKLPSDKKGDRYTCSIIITRQVFRYALQACCFFTRWIQEELFPCLSAHSLFKQNRAPLWSPVLSIRAVYFTAACFLCLLLSRYISASARMNTSPGCLSTPARYSDMPIAIMRSSYPEMRASRNCRMSLSLSS